jgi:transposase
MPRPHKHQVVLSDEDEKKLTKVSKSKKEELRRIERAKILLMACLGIVYTVISDEVGLSTKSVRNTIYKYHTYGIHGALSDTPRSGRPAVIDDEAKTWVIDLACHKPKEVCLPGDEAHTRPEELWTIKTLTGHIHATCEQAGHKCLKNVSGSTVWNILKSHKLHPNRVKYWLQQTDPKHEEKQKKVIGVYREAQEEAARRKLEAPSSDSDKDKQAESENKEREIEVREQVAINYEKRVEAEQNRNDLVKKFKDENKKNSNEIAVIKEKIKELDEQDRNRKADELEEDAKLKEKRELEDKSGHEDEPERQVESEQAEDCKQKKQRRKEEDNKRKEERRKNGQYTRNELKRLRDELGAIKREQKERKVLHQEELKQAEKEISEREGQFQGYMPLNNQAELCRRRVEYISFDEKPGIQALKLVNEDLGCSLEYGCIGRCHEYKRLGTEDLLAGLNLVTGEITPLIRPTHKSSDFIDWLRILDARYADSDLIKIVMDNHSTHNSAETKAYLDSHPGRFEFIFTPTHGSWLNLIESFFGKLSRVCLKNIRVDSKDELSERIYRYIKEINKNPIVYKWTYKIDE